MDSDTSVKCGMITQTANLAILSFNEKYIDIHWSILLLQGVYTFLSKGGIIF